MTCSSHGFAATARSGNLELAFDARMREIEHHLARATCAAEVPRTGAIDQGLAAPPEPL